MILIESLSLKEIPQRLASFLLHALTREGDREINRLELTITQRELAKILGATPESCHDPRDHKVGFNSQKEFHKFSSTNFLLAIPILSS